MVELEADADDRGVTLIVRDQGPGLPESVGTTIIGLRSPDCRRATISALGVWTVCLLTSRLGGRIEAESHDSNGNDDSRRRSRSGRR